MELRLGERMAGPAAAPLLSPADAGALASLVGRLGQPVIVEIGSWLGGSALLMLAAGAAHVHCVDTWRGTDDPADDTRPALHAGRDVFAEFLRNTGGRPVTAHRGDSLAWARAWRMPADLVFIDADHRYEAVSADIAAWTPHVRPGGILAGHDFAPHWPGVCRAVEQSGPFERAGDAVWWRRL